MASPLKLLVRVLNSFIFLKLDVKSHAAGARFENRATADPAVKTLYGSSEIIFRYSSSGKAWSVSVLTAPPDVIVRTIFATVSAFGASVIIIMSYRPIVR